MSTTWPQRTIVTLYGAPSPDLTGIQPMPWTPPPLDPSPLSPLPVSRAEFQQAIESIRAGLRDIEARLDERSIEQTLRHVMDQHEAIAAAQRAEIRRLKAKCNRLARKAKKS